MLGNFFEYFLATGSNGGRLAVLGATSGDTGSAAIAGLRGKRGIHCIILFPHQRVSPIQERQMTTITDANIHCVAIENGTFDDCQDYVKASFDTPDFRDEVHLGAVNSINWCRVLAQTTYYFWSYLRVTDISKDAVKEVHYSVPTGNFGDVLAGYYARCMGLPVGKLIVATNENDILHRFFTKGEYHRHDIAESISPSMDICVSSNFERYLFALAGNDAKKLKAWMDAFESSSSDNSAGKLTLSGDDLRRAQMDFDSARADTKTTLQTIRDYHEQYNYVLCPHSAVGVNAIHQLQLVSTATVCLATAHHAKFPDAVLAALATSSQKDKPLNPASPSALTDLEHLPTRVTVLRKDLKRVQRFVRECVFGRRRNWLLSLSQLQDKEDRVKVIMATALLAGVAAVVVMQILAKKR
jgi:threonine synthase